MNEIIVISDRCRGCGAVLPADSVSDRCAGCSAETTSLVAAGQSGQSRLSGVPGGSRPVDAEIAPRSAASSITLSGPVAAILNNRLLVVAIILVAGPIGLPALWFSPRFSRVTKAITTLGFFLLTVVLPLTGAWYAFEVLLRPLADAIEQANVPR